MLVKRVCCVARKNKIPVVGVLELAGHVQQAFRLGRSFPREDVVRQ